MSAEVYLELQKLITKYIVINFPSFYPIANDIVNDVYIKIIEKGKYDATKGELSTYYLAITKNMILDLIRKNHTEKKRNDVYLDKYDLRDITYNEDIEETDDFKIDNEVNKILDTLTRVEKYLTIEKIINKKSNKELMAELQITEKRLKRYVDKLKLKLRELAYENPILVDYIKNHTSNV